MTSKSNPTSKSSKIRVGITLGDPSGIGPLICAKAIAQLEGEAEFTVIGDRWVYEKGQKAKARRRKVKFIDLGNVRHQEFRFGKVRAEYGRAAVQYLQAALQLLAKNEIDCLVTCPVSKEAVNKSGIRFSGHTEYLAEKTQTDEFCMMLINKDLRFSLVTRHIPLKDVWHSLSQEQIIRTITLTYNALKELFAVKNPRLVVCGLNPHASDNGIIGQEENRVIKPALLRLPAQIKGVFGPLPSDIAISEAARKVYDSVIAMYHDQALIPLKLLGNQTGVNLTLGLPFVRTSPLHGTAFDIAGTQKADPASLICAIQLAIKCASNLKNR